MLHKNVKHHKSQDLPQMTYPIADNLHFNVPFMKRMGKKLKKLYGEDEKVVLVGTGSSGAIVGSYLAILTGYLFRHVKKEGVDAHGKSNLDAFYNAKVVLVDDLIGSGDTMNKLYKQIYKDLLDHNNMVDCVCVTGTVGITKLNFKFNNIICYDTYE